MAADLCFYYIEEKFNIEFNIELHLKIRKQYETQTRTLQPNAHAQSNNGKMAAPFKQA